MIDRRLFWNVDWVLVATTLLLAAIGVAMILSATQSGRSADLYLKQLYLRGPRGRGHAVACLLFDYRRLADRAFLFYLVRRRGARLRALLRAPHRGHPPLAQPPGRPASSPPSS